MKTNTINNTLATLNNALVKADTNISMLRVMLDAVALSKEVTSDNDTKKQRLHFIFDNNVHMFIVYTSKSNALYTVRSSVEFTDSTYHTDWAKSDCYDRKQCTLDTVFRLVSELSNHATVDKKKAKTENTNSNTSAVA